MCGRGAQLALATRPTCAHCGASVARSQRAAFVIPGTEGPEEGPGSDAPQVRAASGPPHQERLGGSLQSRRAAVPGRPLAARSGRVL